MNCALDRAKYLPELHPLEERARNIVINTINLAKHRIGIRQGLEELAESASFEWAGNRICLKDIVVPIPITGEQFICQTIENYWKLTDVFKYHIEYKGRTSDESAWYYYFEVIFSQPTYMYPIPQATASVYFVIKDRPTHKEKAPMMFFRIEGQFTDFDVRYVAPEADWILAVIKQKLKFFHRIEKLRIF